MAKKIIPFITNDKAAKSVLTYTRTLSTHATHATLAHQPTHSTQPTQSTHATHAQQNLQLNPKTKP